MSDTPASLPQVPSPPVNPGLGLIWGLLAALVGFGLLSARYPFVVVSSDFDIGMGAADSARLALMQETDRVNRINAVIIMAVSGGAIGLLLASLANACCGLATRLAAGIVWGGVWGGVAGWIAGTAILWLVPRNAMPGLVNVGATHGLLFGLLGLGLGAMVGGFRRSSQAILNHVMLSGLAGLAGGFFYAVVVGFVAPGEMASQLVPASRAAQFLWLAIPLIAIGASINLVKTR